MGSIHTEVSHTVLKLHLDYHNLQKLKDDPKKIEKMEPEFSERSSDSSKPLQSPRISLIRGTATCCLIFFLLMEKTEPSHTFSMIKTENEKFLSSF